MIPTCAVSLLPLPVWSACSSPLVCPPTRGDGVSTAPSTRRRRCVHRGCGLPCPGDRVWLGGRTIVESLTSMENRLPFNPELFQLPEADCSEHSRPVEAGTSEHED